MTATGPQELLAALRASAGALVDGIEPGSIVGAPAVTGLPAARSGAVLAAWTGARLHAGAPGLLAATNSDVALLVGDWCYAHALQALAHGGDLEAIATLATAIGACATALSQDADASTGGLERLAAIWSDAASDLGAK